MDQLMASAFAKPLKLSRGEQVKGKVIAITDSEIVLDLGGKAEGVLNKKDLTSEQLESLSVGDSLETFVVNPESESGQVVLSAQKQLIIGGKRGAEITKKWQKFYSALQQRTQIKGKVVEENKGGLVVEIDGVRGFLPSSQVGLENMAAGLAGLVGQDISVMVIEVEPSANRLILSARKQISPQIKEKISQLEVGKEISGKVLAIMPFGLIVSIDGVEGIVYSQEIAWEPVEDLSGLFEMGQEVKALIIGKDEELGKVSLSIKKLSEDPFEKLVENFQADDVVKGTITGVTQTGVSVALKDNVEGFLPSAKMEQGTDYTLGKEMSFLVDNIDKSKRKVNLVPFVTSTEGLFYR